MSVRGKIALISMKLVANGHDLSYNYLLLLTDTPNQFYQQLIAWSNFHNILCHVVNR